MRLNKLTLSHYRNYTSVDLSFSENIHVFLGENAQGKTNLLESIYVLAMARSHRANSDKELIKWDEKVARLVGEVEKRQTSVLLEMAISNKGKMTKVNHIEQSRLSEYIGELNVVLFAPEDLYLIKGSPQVRRRFIDMELGQMNPVYLYHLSLYQKTLKQRNKYLKQLGLKKQAQTDEVYLDVLTEQLAQAGSEVIYYRYQFIQQLESWANQLHQKITNHKELLQIIYETSIPVTKEHAKNEIFQIFYEQLKKNQEKDLYKQNTSVGPHRDDLIFLVNQQNVQTYGSQGQQRTTALSVKLAEIELIHDLIGEYPILLLDDVMSELDDERQVHLLSSIENKVQTFITTTSLDHLSDKLTVHPDVFMVKQGVVERISEQSESGRKE
ncbi:DNA replication/repair protein RecF [Vagococcus humatus]|uniref:DNA replication and repair protein RecF n=1 Tax=Vagococcus humatus TaxID=1889241 RepID=A0A429Z4I7_9ENTE|nr:DNA replication/repair protein RecF [Vagococcus humatus]RST88602.1 DNA replication/repair protein RecF [Vagococcus humatus]